MHRLLATTYNDLRIQLRNGFYAATIFVTLLWALILLRAGTLDMRWLLPPLVIGNLLIGTYMFLGGLVLLERGEGTLVAQSITPLRVGEYLAAKLATLTVLALAETLVIVPLIAGWRFTMLPLIAAVVLASAIYCLAGCIVVARYTSVNEYLLPAGMFAGLLWLPLLAYLAQWQHWLLYLHPLSGPLTLAEAAFAPMAPWRLAIGLASALGWAGVLGWAGSAALRRALGLKPSAMVRSPLRRAQRGICCKTP